MKNIKLAIELVNTKYAELINGDIATLASRIESQTNERRINGMNKDLLNLKLAQNLELSDSAKIEIVEILAGSIVTNSMQSVDANESCPSDLVQFAMACNGLKIRGYR
jgi:hypothetical protein